MKGVMIEPERVKSDLPGLDRADGPRGGVAVWALLVIAVAVATAVVVGILLAAH